MYEGGIRVPMMVRGPGVKANSQCDVPVAGWDLVPTLEELVGGQVSPDDALDGGSFAGLLRSEGRGKVERRTPELIFHRYHPGYPHSALIDGDLKVIKFWKTGKVELYNLANDIGEQTDIASKNRRKAAELENKLTVYLERVNPGLTASYTK